MKRVWSEVKFEELDISMTFNGGSNGTTELEVYQKYHEGRPGAIATSSQEKQNSIVVFLLQRFLLYILQFLDSVFIVFSNIPEFSELWTVF